MNRSQNSYPAATAGAPYLARFWRDVGNESALPCGPSRVCSLGPERTRIFHYAHAVQAPRVRLSVERAACSPPPPRVYTGNPGERSGRDLRFPVPVLTRSLAPRYKKKGALIMPRTSCQIRAPGRSFSRLKPNRHASAAAWHRPLAGQKPPS
jgi:hypothetical protein